MLIICLKLKYRKKHLQQTTNHAVTLLFDSRIASNNKTNDP